MTACAPRRVLLIDMPFSSLRPSLALGLLERHAAAAGWVADVRYFKLDFARMIGVDAYQFVAEYCPPDLLMGEWVFSLPLSPNFDPSPFIRYAQRRHPVLFKPANVNLAWSMRAAAEGFIDQCAAAVDWHAYDLVGFSTTFCQNSAALALAARIKALAPRLPIVFGGANCEGEMGLGLHRAYPFIDYVCCGEADLSFPALLGELAKGAPPPHPINGVVWRTGQGSGYTSLAADRVTDLDALPIPDYGTFFRQQAELLPDHNACDVPIETSRGCWWGQKHVCTFCGLNGDGLRYRSKSAGRALEEVAQATSYPGVSWLIATDNILDMHYFRDVLPKLRWGDRDVTLFYETKANLSEQQVRTLAEAGIKIIQPGIESLSTDVLGLIRKGCSALQNIRLLKLCRLHGIRPVWNLLYGFPGEKEEHYAGMADLIDAIRHFEPPKAMIPLRLDRFSAYFRDPDRWGLSDVRPSPAYALAYDLAAEDLASIAYYFDYRHVDGRNPDSYTAQVQTAVDRWQKVVGGRGLVSNDDGTQLLILDFRDGARQVITVLEGAERHLYVSCDAPLPANQVFRAGAVQGLARDTVASFLCRMRDLQLMVEVDGQWLGIAIPLSAAEGRLGAAGASDGL